MQANAGTPSAASAAAWSANESLAVAERLVDVGAAPELHAEQDLLVGPASWLINVAHHLANMLNI